MLTRYYKQSGILSLSVPAMVTLVVFGAVLFAGSMVVVGYHTGQQSAAKQFTQQQESGEASELVSLMKAWMVTEQEKLSWAQLETEDHLDALAMRLARLQAEMMRVEAVGERLVTMADLDAGEFDFSTPPAIGGPEGPVLEPSQSSGDLLAGMAALDRMLHERAEQLTLLEEWLMNNDVRHQTLPSGLPVEGGWVSSGFGRRINPVTGKAQTHKGVDIPGARGDDVIAVAAGVVVRSGVMGGYGNAVEIRHANGFSTMYAHNEANLVEVGEVVEKGQVIAKLGRTGRATGPHVHFEVRKDGNPVNPRDFITSAKG